MEILSRVSPFGGAATHFSFCIVEVCLPFWRTSRSLLCLLALRKLYFAWAAYSAVQLHRISISPLCKEMSSTCHHCQGPGAHAESHPISRNRIIVCGDCYRGLIMRCEFIEEHYLPPSSFTRLCQYFGIAFNEGIRNIFALRLPYALDYPSSREAVINQNLYSLISEAFKQHIAQCADNRRLELANLGNSGQNWARKAIRRELRADMNDCGFPVHLPGLNFIQVYTYFVAYRAGLIPIRPRAQPMQLANALNLEPGSTSRPGALTSATLNEECERQASTMANRLTEGEGEVVAFHNDFTSMPPPARAIYALCSKDDDENGMPIALLDESVMKLSRQQLSFIASNRRYFRYCACFSSSRTFLENLQHILHC